MRRVLAGLALALSVAVAAHESPPAAGAATTAAAEGTMNHAAVVVDTGDGNVRKMCLAFPEAEITGIEALQRVDTRPHRFETFDSKGSGVCMLCGVGCASGDCFCNPSKYWAYHRAGPGESTYRASSLGASSTMVRNGDVEAWKWGPGTAPAKTTVSEVCGVPEPPSRTASATSTTPAPTTTEPTTTTTEAGQSPAGATETPTARSAPTSTPTAPRQGAGGSPTTTPPPPGAPEAATSEPTDATTPDATEQEAAAPAAAEVERSLGAEAGAAADTNEGQEGTSGGQLATLAAFTALLGGLLVWRSRLRRANVRRVRPVR